MTPLNLIGPVRRTIDDRRAVACRGGCGRCDGIGHPPWGHPRGQFYIKNVGKWQKMKRKMSLPRHDAAREGASRERIVLPWNLTTDKKGRLKFCGMNRKYFRGHPRTSLQQPLHATAAEVNY